MNTKSFKFARSFASGGAALVCLLFVGQTSVGEIIPAARRINWDPGIPGGIPERTTIYKMLDTIDNTGASDVTSAIQSALNSCPAGQVVKLPAGTFRINGGITMPNNVTLRGSGPSTVLKSYGGPAGLFQFGTSTVQWDPASISTTISSGSTAGSTLITVASISGITAGTYLVITELNDPAFVSIQGSYNGPATWVDAWNTAGTRARGQIVEVTSVSGNTVNFTPALYGAYTRTPWATRFSASCKWSGVEDLKTYANNTGCQRNFLFQCAAYCWVKNVECDFTDGDHVTLDWSYRCEIRHSYFHDAYIHSAGNFDTMIGLRAKSSACLVIDNILRRLHVSVMCEWGAAGNVIAYNYDQGDYDDVVASGTRHLPGSMNANHGAHPQFNLFEGNVCQRILADSFWGSSSDTTLFRNSITGTDTVHPPYSTRGVEDTSVSAALIQANRAVDLWEIQYRYNVVGNVIGDSSLKARGVVRKVVNPASRAYDNPPYCYSYGYTSESGGGGTALANPSLTVLEHGNWDVADNATVWDSTITDHVIPNSLFLSSKPVWFGNLAWPPIDPLRPSMSPTNIPAGYRYILGVDPASGPVNLAPTAVATATPTVGLVPLTVSFLSAGSADPEGAALSYAWTFGDSTTSTTANPSHVYTTNGTYSARLTVSDGTNSTASSILTITVTTPTNLAPVAAADATPRSGTSPLTVNFSSAGSTDPEGAALTYSWNFGDGTTATSANPSHTYSVAGNYSAQMIVSDGTNSVASSATAITATGLLAAYGFEETNGTVVVDANANRSSGTITNATRVTSGKYGRALSFNGTNALVAVSNTTALTLSSNMTIEAWVNPASVANSWMPIVFKPYDSTQISYVMQGATPLNGVPCVYVSPGAGNVLADNALPANIWSHLAATYDGATIRLYTNGVLAASQAQTGVISSSSQPLTIGGNATFQAYWKGLVDEVRIYNRALSVAEIRSDMTNSVDAAASRPPAVPQNVRVVGP